MTYLNYEEFSAYMLAYGRVEKPILHYIAIRKNHLDMPLLVLHKSNEFGLTRRAMNALLRHIPGESGTLRDVLQLSLSQIMSIPAMGQASIENFKRVLYQAAVPIPHDYDEEEHYRAEDLQRIFLIGTKEEVVQQLQDGIYKGAFIGRDGVWLKPRPAPQPQVRRPEQAV
ncbi:hypothetical protein [Paenibacillus xanthanilyticus]|uniref:Uncharacterized protein n=1 Tax=Paenibacillus xanthanilyticus TaxID=1783531 RepID=A0ABV8JVD7_9BACL